MTAPIRTFVFALAGAAAIAGSAHATGFERGTADTDILFEQGNFNMRAGLTYVNPTRKYTATAANNLNPVGTDFIDSYVVPSFAAKIDLTDDLRCAATLTDSFGGSTSTPAPTGATGKLSESFTATEMAATCAYFIPVGAGSAFVLGGAYYEIFEYDLLAGAGALTASLSDAGLGWRIGAGYERPEIGLRAQLIYRSGLTVEATGSASNPIATSPATGDAKTPQSIEFRGQTGIAPGWLALGSIRWTDWSVNEQLVLTSAAIPGGVSANDYFWRDGWTVTGGVGHQFSEQFSGAAFLTYRSDVGTGFDLAWASWTVGGTINANGEFGQLSVGGGVSFLGSATDIDGNAVGNDTSYAVNARYAIRW